VPGAQSDDTDRFRRERRRVGPSADRGPRAPRVEESVGTDPALHAEERSPGNLPLELTSFIGRKKELAAVKGLLAGQLLLTLTGPGGSGKTRLALAVALEVVEGFEDGAWWVGLASLSDSALVAQAVASVLGVRETPGRSLIEALVEHLKPKEVRLILDNCEHLIDACAALTDKLLHSCPNLHILATNREALGVAGETTWPVPPLSASANVIAFSGQDGVMIEGGTGNRVLRNAIFSSLAGLAIDLGGDGLTANDPGDADTGANDLQNKPAIASARTSAEKTTIRGALGSKPNQTFMVRFFSNPSGTDEGKTFIGKKKVTTGSDGKASFIFSPARKVGVGKTVTAAATGSEGTSEFSAPKIVAAQ
jgi:hypothetical protein